MRAAPGAESIHYQAVSRGTPRLPNTITEPPWFRHVPRQECGIVVGCLRERQASEPPDEISIWIDTVGFAGLHK